MGTDMHMHIEVKTGGEWHHLSAPCVPRRYRYFAKMAGVRNSYDIEPLSQPKGLPPDMTFLTEIHAAKWAGDGHSHSWLGKEEIAEFSVWFDDLEDKTKGDDCIEDWLSTYLHGSNCLDIARYPEDCPSWVEDLRLVFWFDC